jgi:hypothetical protein
MRTTTEGSRTMTAEWYYARGKEHVGPVTDQQLKELVRSGEVSRTDMVWRQGMAKWQRAGEVEGLFDDEPRPAPPSLPEAETEAPALAESPAVRSPKELKPPLVAVFAVCGLALLTGLVGVLNADRPGVRILLAIGVAHNLAAVALAVTVARLRNYGLASLAPWVVMTCWAWHWFTNMTHGMTLLGMLLAVSAGVWLLVVVRGKGVRRAFEAEPPLPPLFSLSGSGKVSAPHYTLDPATRFPWATSEREQPNPKLKFGTWGVVGVGVVALLLFFTDAAILGLWLLGVVVLFSVFWIRVLWGLMLRGRWVPVDGDGGWVEFLSGYTFRRDDGTVGTFALLPNQKFIDILVSGHLVDSWKILAWGDKTLEIQDIRGRTRSLRKGKTLEEKKASFFHSDRTDHLPGSWVPIDGSGEWVQFTEDGAVVYSDGRAGRYTVTDEEPNEVIRVKLADGSACEYRVMSLSKTQLVIVDGTKARTYKRHGQKAVAAGTDPVSSEDAHPEQGSGKSVGGFLTGLWNRLTKWPCLECRSRNTTVVNSVITERRQEVMTDFSQGSSGHRPQAVYNVFTHHDDCRCKDCGHEWIQEHTTRSKA